MVSRHEYMNALPAMRTDLKAKFGSDERDLFQQLHGTSHIGDTRTSSGYKVVATSKGATANRMAKNPTYTSQGNEDWWYQS